MKKAYVLLNVEAPDSAAATLSKLPGVVKVSVVRCESRDGFNAVVEVSGETLDELKENVKRAARAEFVKSSCTLLAAGSR